MHKFDDFLKLEEAKAGYELYHKDFSSAMQHAYDHAKKKHGITIKPSEIDDKVASGPRKPSNGKTNTYRLKGDKGAIQVQVYNTGNKYELNMYKESIDEGRALDALRKDMSKRTASNQSDHAANKARATKNQKDLEDFRKKNSKVLNKKNNEEKEPVSEVSDQMKARYIRGADASHRAARSNEREAIIANKPEKAKKFKDIMKKRNAGMTKAFGEDVTETKGAPKGYHFTRDGKLKKGDAGADGDGGAKLRSDPLDKLRSKIPPIPEKFANPAQQAAVMAKLKKSGKYDGKESFGRANLLSRLKSKGMDVDKMHSNNMKDADAAKKRSAAAEKDLVSFRKKTGVTSESKDEKFEPHMMYDLKTGEGKMAKVKADHIRMKKMGYSHDKPKLDELSMNTLSSYKDKAKYSRDKAQNSAAANYMRGTKGSGGKNDPDIKTMQKRDHGEKLYYGNLANKLRKQFSAMKKKND